MARAKPSTPGDEGSAVRNSDHRVRTTTGQGFDCRAGLQPPEASPSRGGWPSLLGSGIRAAAAVQDRESEAFPAAAIALHIRLGEHRDDGIRTTGARGTSGSGSRADRQVA